MINSKSSIKLNPEQKFLSCVSSLEYRNLLPKQSQSKTLSPNNCQDFWQIWESNQGYFYKCCLKWMGGNSYDAEDALNQAMVTAWNEWTKSTNKIIYPKAWLNRIIYNFCMNMHRQRKREATKLENIDQIKFAEHPAFASEGGFPESNILALEMEAYLDHKIKSLPDRLRHTIILHCYQEKSYKDIAEQLAISQENVRKRIQEARKILQKHLQKYLAGEDKTYIDSLSPSLNKEITKGENLQSDETLRPLSATESPDESDAVVCDSESSIPTKNNREEFSYKMVTLCVQTLPHSWYNSPSYQGWT